MDFENVVFYAGGAFRHGGFSVLHGRFSAVQGDIYGHISPEGDFFIPGMVDIHTHGAMGFDTCDADPVGLAKMSRFYAEHGVTSFCATGMTYDEVTLENVVSTAAAFEHGAGARCLGINLEGPFIAPSKKGAQNGKYIVPPDMALFDRLNGAAHGKILLADIAPETPGAMAFIRAASKTTTVSVAHTAADYDTAAAAFAAGATHLTHSFNAMPPLLHRDPGPIAAAADARAYAELICDGIHIHPSVIRAAFRIFGRDRVCVVSDSMRAAGLPDGEYELGGQPVFVSGGRAALSDGTIAGSCTNMQAELRGLLDYGIDPYVAVGACTLNPARSIKLAGEVGSIGQGLRADFLLLDRKWELKAVWIDGKEII